MEYLGDFGNESGEREHKTEQRKKLRKLSKGKLWIKVASLAAILGASFVYMKMRIWLLIMPNP
jgi:hypothetical protein